MQNLRVLLRLAARHVLVSLVNSHNQVTVYSHQTAQRYN